MARQPEPVRVFLTPPGGEPLALYAERPPAVEGGRFVVTLAFEYPGLAVGHGWAVKGRGFAGTVEGVEGRALTCEVTP